MTPLVPYSFDPPVEEEGDPRLVYEEAVGGQRVTWPTVGVSLLIPEKEFGAKLSEIAAANPNNFINHGYTGFSIGQYHEFFVTPGAERFVGLKLGQVEATFGLASPLVALTFSMHHRAKYFGDWSEIWTLRIFGASQDDAEAIALNACSHYAEVCGHLPHFWDLNDEVFYSWDDEAEQEADEDVKTLPPSVMDLDAMRFYYEGIKQDDDVAASIYFYRVIEYYSFLANAREIKKLRHDQSLSDYDFSRSILNLVSRDEKGPVFKLIAKLASIDFLTKAKSAGLIQTATETALAEGVYSFRNSVVHGKFSYGFTLRSSPLFTPDTNIFRWRGALRELAKRAIDNFGSRAV